MKTLLLTTLLLLTPAIGSTMDTLSTASELNRAANNHITKQQAARIAKSHSPGRVLAVTRNKNTFRVKILRNNGNVVIVSVNAKTGKVK